MNGFLAEGRYEPGLKHGISSTYLFLDQEMSPPLVGYAQRERQRTDPERSVSMRLDLLEALHGPEAVAMPQAAVATGS